MKTDVDVAIVGCGQAGLSTSWYLKPAGVEHVILEAGATTSSTTCSGGPTRSVRPSSKVARSPHLEADGDRFVLTVPAGKVRARRVVVTSGGYQRAHLPARASEVSPDALQLLAEEYRNPDALPDGAVLIVGSGQTGCQIAEELHEARRRVVLACGRAPWAPRRISGRDVVWWVIESCFWNRSLAELPSPSARLISNVLAAGHGGGHDMHLRTLHAKGIQPAGHFTGAEDGRVRFADDLAETFAASDALAASFKNGATRSRRRVDWRSAGSWVRLPRSRRLPSSTSVARASAP